MTSRTVPALNEFAAVVEGRAHRAVGLGVAHDVDDSGLPAGDGPPDGGRDTVRVKDAFAVARKAFGDLDIVDHALVFRHCDVALVPICVLLVLPDEAQVGVVHDHHNYGDVVCRAHGKLLHMEREPEVAHDGDGAFASRDRSAECGGDIVAERARAAGREVMARQVNLLQLTGPYLGYAAAGRENDIVAKLERHIRTENDVVSAVYILAICRLFGWGTQRDAQGAVEMFRNGDVFRKYAYQTDNTRLSAAIRLYYYCAACAGAQQPVLPRRERTMDWVVLADYLYSNRRRGRRGVFRIRGNIERAGLSINPPPDPVYLRRLRFLCAQARGARESYITETELSYVRGALIGGIREDIESAVNLLTYIGDTKGFQDEIAIGAMLGHRGLFWSIDEKTAITGLHRYMQAQSDEDKAYAYAEHCLSNHDEMLKSAQSESKPGADAIARLFAITIAWLKKLADNGYAPAQKKLSKVLVESDSEASLEYLRAHAEHDASSKIELFRRLRDNKGRLGETISAAMEIYARDITAAIWLGDHYYRTNDYEKAIMVWRSHAGLNRPEIDMRLSHCYLHGLGTEINYGTAYSYVKGYADSDKTDETRLAATMFRAYKLGTNEQVNYEQSREKPSEKTLWRKWHIVMGLCLVTEQDLMTRLVISRLCSTIRRSEIPNKACTYRHVRPLVNLCELSYSIRKQRPGKWPETIAKALGHFKAAANLESGFAGVLVNLLDPETPALAEHTSYLTEIFSMLLITYMQDKDSFIELRMIVPFMHELIKMLDGLQFRVDAQVETDEWVINKKRGKAAKLGDGRASFILSKESPTLLDHRPRKLLETAELCNIGAAYLMRWYVAGTNKEVARAIRGAIRAGIQPVEPGSKVKVIDITVSRIWTYRYSGGRLDWLYNLILLPLQRVRVQWARIWISRN